MHLVNGLRRPTRAVLLMVRSSKNEFKDCDLRFWIIAIASVYLRCVSVLEVGQVVELGLPQVHYDPTLSIHFGRARGPMLQSVRLGVLLTGQLDHHLRIHNMVEATVAFALDLFAGNLALDHACRYGHLHAKYLDGPYRSAGVGGCSCV